MARKCRNKFEENRRIKNCPVCSYTCDHGHLSRHVRRHLDREKDPAKLKLLDDFFSRKESNTTNRAGESEANATKPKSKAAAAPSAPQISQAAGSSQQRSFSVGLPEAKEKRHRTASVGAAKRSLSPTTTPKLDEVKKPRRVSTISSKETNEAPRVAPQNGEMSGESGERSASNDTQRRSRSLSLTSKPEPATTMADGSQTTNESAVAPHKGEMAEENASDNLRRRRSLSLTPKKKLATTMVDDGSKASNGSSDRLPISKESKTEKRTEGVQKNKETESEQGSFDEVAIANNSQTGSVETDENKDSETEQGHLAEMVAAENSEAEGVKIGVLKEMESTNTEQSTFVGRNDAAAIVEVSTGCPRFSEDNFDSPFLTRKSGTTMADLFSHSDDDHNGSDIPAPAPFDLEEENNIFEDSLGKESSPISPQILNLNKTSRKRKFKAFKKKAVHAGSRLHRDKIRKLTGRRFIRQSDRDGDHTGSDIDAPDPFPAGAPSLQPSGSSRSKGHLNGIHSRKLRTRPSMPEQQPPPKNNNNSGELVDDGTWSDFESSGSSEVYDPTKGEMDVSEQDSDFSEEDKPRKKSRPSPSKAVKSRKARGMSQVVGEEEIEESAEAVQKPKKTSSAKVPKTKGRKQFRNLKVCPHCNFRTRDHLARHITRWHNVTLDTARKMAKQASKKTVVEPPPLLASVVTEVLGPFAAIPDCMSRVKRLLRMINIQVVEKLPDEPAMDLDDPDDPPISQALAGTPPPATTHQATNDDQLRNEDQPRNNENSNNLVNKEKSGNSTGATKKTVRELSKEVGLDKAASSSHVIMSKFKQQTLDKDRSANKYVSKSYCDRLAKLLGFIRFRYPDESEWDNLVNVDGSREFLQKMAQANYTSASILTYVKEALKCCKLAQDRWSLLPDFPDTPQYHKSLKHAVLFWTDTQTNFNKAAIEDKDKKLEVEEIPPMGPAFEYFEDAKNQKIVDDALTQCEKYCEERNRIHIYPGGKDRVLNVYYEKAVRWIGARQLVWSAQRIGVLQNLTLEEFAGATSQDGEWVVLVGKHKTSATYGNAKLIFEEDEWNRISRLHQIRLKMAFPNNDENPPNFFVQSTGAIYKHFFNDVNSATNLNVTTRNCRKYAASAAKNESGEVRAAVCRAMKHSATVRDSNYVYRTKEHAVKDSRLVKNALKQQKVIEKVISDGSDIFDEIKELVFPSKEELENIIMDKYIVGVELNQANYDIIRKRWEEKNYDRFAAEMAKAIQTWSPTEVERKVRKAGWNPSKQLLTKIKNAMEPAEPLNRSPESTVPTQKATSDDHENE